MTTITLKVGGTPAEGAQCQVADDETAIARVNRAIANTPVAWSYDAPTKTWTGLGTSPVNTIELT